MTDTRTMPKWIDDLFETMEDNATPEVFRRMLRCTKRWGTLSDDELSSLDYACRVLVMKEAKREDSPIFATAIDMTKELARGHDATLHPGFLADRHTNREHLEQYLEKTEAAYEEVKGDARAAKSIHLRIPREEYEESQKKQQAHDTAKSAYWVARTMVIGFDSAPKGYPYALGLCRLGVDWQDILPLAQAVRARLSDRILTTIEESIYLATEEA